MMEVTWGWKRLQIHFSCCMRVGVVVCEETSHLHVTPKLHHSTANSGVRLLVNS